MAQRHRMPCQAEEITIQNIVYVNYSVIMIAIMAGHYIILLTKSNTDHFRSHVTLNIGEQIKIKYNSNINYISIDIIDC